MGPRLAPIKVSSMLIKGISHATFIVSDLDRMAALFCDVLGAEEVYDSAGRNYSLSREKFFILGGVWIAAMEGTAPAERSYGHLAFAVDEADLDALEPKIRSLGLDVLPARPRVEGEGRSIYFYDFDNHLFELHTGTLNTRLARYLAE